MCKRVLSLLLVVIMLAGMISVSAANAPTEAEAYQKIIAMKSYYYNGKPWSNANSYKWRIGNSARGCMGFANLMSDCAFGYLPARKIYPSKNNPIKISQLRVGDILRLPGHSVVVLQKSANSITIVEGNASGRVRWGRTLTAAQVSRANYFMTRYPN